MMYHCNDIIMIKMFQTHILKIVGKFFFLTCHSVSWLSGGYVSRSCRCKTAVQGHHGNHTKGWPQHLLHCRYNGRAYLPIQNEWRVGAEIFLMRNGHPTSKQGLSHVSSKWHPLTNSCSNLIDLLGFDVYLPNSHHMKIQIICHVDKFTLGHKVRTLERLQVRQFAYGAAEVYQFRLLITSFESKACWYFRLWHQQTFCCPVCIPLIISTHCHHQ